MYLAHHELESKYNTDTVISAGRQQARLAVVCVQHDAISLTASICRQMGTKSAIFNAT